MADSNNETKKGSMMTIVLIGMFSFMITVVIAGTFLFLKFKDSDKSVAIAQNGARMVEEIGPLVSLGPEIIVNLSSPEGLEHYLKVNITLEAVDQKTSEELTKRIPQIRDLVIGILSSKTTEKINEKEGKEQIRKEIISTVNSHLVRGQIKNIFFQDFVIQ